MYVGLHHKCNYSSDNINVGLISVCHSGGLVLERRCNHVDFNTTQTLCRGRSCFDVQRPLIHVNVVSKCDDADQYTYPGTHTNVGFVNKIIVGMIDSQLMKCLISVCHSSGFVFERR
jgi:hypothetical protein